MAQLYCGRDSYLTDVFGMKEETEMPGTLLDFILKWGAMDGLFSDNAKVQTSYAVQDILRQYNINDMQSEPEMQHQNPAERRIQEVKSMTNTLMDRSGSPKHLWFLCMLYVVMILNCSAGPNLNMRTPIEAALGYTPDISALLCFVWYQPVFYYRTEGKTPFPESKEKLGRFVGISENKGDALTFQVLTDDTKEIIHRLVVRPADDPKHPNARLFPEGGELDKLASEIKNPVVESEADCIDPSRLKLPDINPENMVGMTFLREQEVDGPIYRAEVVKRLEKDDADREQFLVSLGDGKRQEVLEYHALLEILKKHTAEEEGQDNNDKLYAFYEVEGHRKKGQGWEILVHWEDGSKTWEPLGMIRKSDPVSVAQYAQKHDLLDVPGWKRFKSYVRNQKKVNRMLKQARLNSRRTSPKFKFGVEVARNWNDAERLDKENKNTLWKEARDTELAQLNDYNTFENKGKGTKLPHGYQKIRVHFVFDVKYDL